MPTTIQSFLENARSGLKRLTASEAREATERGAILIDTRTEEQRRTVGAIPGARLHPLSVLEWRLCPTSDSHDPEISHDDQIVVICAQGYSSSLAAARLQALGFSRATDMIDGVEGWRRAGHPLISA